jgi:hypothetical protein
VLRARRRASPAQPGGRIEEAPRGWLFLTALFLGLSFGVKHVALFGAIPIGLLLLDEIRRRRGVLRLCLAAALIFAASGLFWHVRTFLLTGNPIYPAGARHLSSTQRALDGTRPSRWTTHLLYPWIAHFDGHKVMESPTANPLGFFFVFFVCNWVLTRRRRRSEAELALLFFLVIYYLYWAYIWGVLRYALAPLLVLALLTAGRAAVVERQAGPRLRTTLAAALAYCLAFALLPAMILEVNAYQFPYFAGQLDRAGYLRAVLADYGAIEFLNEHAGPDAQILGVNNCASAYANDPARFPCVRFFSISPERARFTAELAEATKPDYLVLPAGERGDAILDALGPSYKNKPIYSDTAFQVLSREGP